MIFKKELTVLGYLKNIYGVNTKIALFMCKSCGILSKTPIKFLSERQKRSFIIIIEEKFIGVFYFGDSLKEFKKKEYEKFCSVKSYKIIRRIKKLPVNGQRTKTNARTVRKIFKW